MDTINILKDVTTVDGATDDNWTDGSNTTITYDTTDYMKGTGSLLLTVAAGAGASEILGYRNYTAIDLSGVDTVVLWLRSSISLSAADIEFRMSETSALGGTPLEMEIPALTAGVWTRVELTIPGATTARDAILSVGIFQNVDSGAFTLNVDDIVAGNVGTYNILSLLGFHKGESTSRYPELDDVTLLDGSISRRVSRFRRNVVVRFHAFDTEAEMNWLQDALDLNASVRLLHSNDEVEGVPMTDGFTGEWIGGFSETIGATVYFREKEAQWSQTRKPPSFA